MKLNEWQLMVIVYNTLSMHSNQLFQCVHLVVQFYTHHQSAIVIENNTNESLFLRTVFTCIIYI